MMHQLDNLSNLVHEHLAQLSGQKRSDTTRTLYLDLVGSPLILTIAVGGIGFFLLKGLSRT